MAYGNIWLLIALILYIVISKIIFDTVYQTSKLVIDEEFHLPLGEKYCEFNFRQWDSKVTTLPGLYILSALLLGPFGLCSIYWLRMVSFICSCVNLLMFYILFSQNTRGDQRKIFSAIMLALLPPLYFFSHLYYTDVASLTSVLFVVTFSEFEYYYLASLAGFISIVFRQTNVIFVMMYGAKYALTESYKVWAQQQNVTLTGKLPATNLKPFLTHFIANPAKILSNLSLPFWLNLSCYAATVISFLIFVACNGSIVVGDKNAHQMTLHTPQVFYFCIFCIVFGWPHFVGEILKFLRFAKAHKLKMFLYLILSGLIVHLNTQVHPYLLADNRHYTFYIWNRFYAKYWFFTYLMTPVYVFAVHVTVKALWNKHDVSFCLTYIPAVTILLVTQKLIQERYFLVPYILLRLKLKYKNSSAFNVALEFATYIIINVTTFEIFFNKVLYWNDRDDPQRIIW